MTYNAILSAMKNAFYEKTGRDVEAFSDLAVRFSCVASELYSLYCHSEYIRRQSVPQLSGGETLNFYAALFGLERKTAVAAQGSLTFTLSEARTESTEVPQGCICSAQGAPYLQFVTTQAGIVPAGELSVTLPAEACETGERYNVATGEVTVMVNPPLYIGTVTNTAAFYGGSDAESDAALKDRLREACSVIPTGYSSESIRQLLLRHDEILDCNVYSDGEMLHVLVKPKSGSLSAQIRAYVYQCTKIADLLEMEVDVTETQDYPYLLAVDAVCDTVEEDTQEKIRAAVRSYTDGIRLGRGIYLQEVACAVSGVEEVRYARVTSPQAYNDVIYTGYGKYPVPQEIRVSCHE